MPTPTLTRNVMPRCRVFYQISSQLSQTKGCYISQGCDLIRSRTDDSKESPGSHLWIFHIRFGCIAISLCWTLVIGYDTSKMSMILPHPYSTWNFGVIPCPFEQIGASLPPGRPEANCLLIIFKKLCDHNMIRYTNVTERWTDGRTTYIIALCRA